MYCTYMTEFLKFINLFLYCSWVGVIVFTDDFLGNGGGEWGSGRVGGGRERGGERGR